MRKPRKFRIDPSRKHFKTTRWLQLKVGRSWVTVARLWLNNPGQPWQDGDTVSAIEDLLLDGAGIGIPLGLL